jgi:N6-adenosine-specific RNA methylase IME4
MSTDEIKALPVHDLANQDAHLYLWTTNRYLPDAFDVLRTWGFAYSKTLVWCKTPMGLGLGGTWAQSTEYVLFGRRGTLSTLTKFDTNWWNWTRTANGRHSAKPDAFLDMVEQASPGPYVELFARRARFGWDYWGNESLGTAEMGSAA